MAVFELRGPDGKTYEVKAPDVQSAVGAFQKMTSGGEDVSVAGDMAKSAGVGVAKGVIGMGGLPGDARQLVSKAFSYGMDKLGADPQAIEATKNIASQVGRAIPMTAPFMGPGSQEIQKTVEGVTGEFYKPKTTAGEYAQTVGEFLPGAAIGPGGIGQRIATQAVIPALTSETAGQLTEGSRFEPYARVGGAVAGALAPSAIGRVITPAPISAERQALVNVLRGEGVHPTAGQATGRKSLQYAESALGDAPFGGNRATQAMERTGEQFTRAALRRVGENANRATPDVVDRAFTRIGRQFDDLSSRANVSFDPQLVDDLRNVRREYESLVGPSQRRPAVTEVIDDVMNMGPVGPAQNRPANFAPGDAYQSLRSRLGRLQEGVRTDPEASTALREIREALDDAVQRAGLSPADQQAWDEARRQYRNLMVVEKAATGAGENTAQGIISPSQLRNATVNQNRRAYARGDGDFADLARAGEAILKPLPQSGTAPRAMAQGLPTLLGAGLGGATGGGPGAVAGVMASAIAPGLAGRALHSQPVQAWLQNQALAGPLAQVDPRTAAMIQLLLAEPRAQLADR